MDTYDKSSAPPAYDGPPNYVQTSYSYPGQHGPTNPPYSYPDQQQEAYNSPANAPPYSSQPSNSFVDQPQQGHGQPQEQNITSSYISNENNGETVNFANFDEKSIRLGFIKKVFGILAVQMLITGGIMCAFVFSDTIKDYTKDHHWVYIASICIYFACIMALACCDNARRKVPLNLILLFVLTLAMSVMLGSIASSFDAKEILMAVGIVFGIVVVCAILGVQQKFDFTYLLGIMVVLTFGLIFFGLFCAIFRSNFANIAYACIGAVLFSLWLVIDIQMIMGGKHKYQCDPEEYIFAALNLYLDIVNILMYVLMIIGGSNK